MKLFGEKPKGPNVCVLVLPRQDYDIVIKAQAILDQEAFEILCPRPKPPSIMKPGGVFEQDVNDPKFKASIEKWAEKKTAWVVLESLKATPKDMLEWETVDYNNPDSWLKWKDELRDAFFTDQEIMQILNTVWQANGINQAVLDEARNRFLAGQARLYIKPLSPTADQSSMPNGEPVKDSA